MAVADYAEKDAEMLTSTGSSQTAEHVFTRGWKPGSGADARRAIIEAELRAILFVVNPKTDRGKSEHLGTYDVVASGWDGKYLGYIQTLKKRTPYTLPAVVVAEDVYSTTTEQVMRNQESEAVAKTWLGALVAGVTRKISAAADAMKKWTVEAVTVTSKEVSYSYSYTPIIGGKPIYFYVERNRRVDEPTFAAVPEALSGIHELSVGGVQKNPDGTWNWSYTYKERDILLAAGESKTITTGGGKKYRKQIRYDAGLVIDPNQKLDVNGNPISGVMVYTYPEWWYSAFEYKGVKYQCYASAALAWAATSNGFPISRPPSKIADGLWLAHWEYDYTSTIWNPEQRA